MNKSKKQRKRAEKTKIMFKDKKGHEVHRVSIRITSTQSAWALPYFYCEKCDRFIPTSKQEKKTVVRVE